MKKGKVLKTTLQCFFGLLFAHYTVSAQNVAGTQFDLSKVPFSRYGSYMSLSTSDRDSNGKEEIHLYELSGKNVFSFNGVLKIEPAKGQEVIPVDYTATPLIVNGKTKAGTIKFYYETPEILHILSDGPAIIMSGNLNTNNTLPVPGFDRTWKLRDSRFTVTIKSGQGKFNESGQAGFFRIEPVDGKLDIVIDQYNSDWLPKTYRKSFQESISELTAEIQKWDEETPSVPPAYRNARNLASYVNWSSMIKPQGNITRYGMVMSKNWMYNIWSWDNCFNAISLGYHQPNASWDQIMVLFDHQDNTGAIPDYINAHHMVWEFRKPPIHGWTLAKLMKQYQLNDTQLNDIYKKLTLWTNYWFDYRDGDHNGLPEYYHGNDSGWDNSTSFDTGFPAEGADLAALLIEQMDVLSEVAMKIQKPDEAKKWKQRADATLGKMIAELWNGDKFVSRNAVTGQINTESQSLMSYLPILLGERLPEKIRKKMISDLKRPDYLVTTYGLATESPQSKLYVPDGYWRGPIWAPTTLMVIDGLQRSNETKFAKELAVKFSDLCNKSGFAENFNAISGEALRDPAYTWTSSVFLILAHDYIK